MSKGTYCLIIRMPKTKTIKIGKNEPFKFRPGYYCYVGSAMNNLEKRIARHKSRDKKFHWHIDWFLTETKIVGVRSIVSTIRLECALSRELARISEGQVMKGFGSSDCACPAHLHYFKKSPSGKLDRIIKRLVKFK